ncbi:mucoidy inhibitor MuiA family protein [Geopseudomonas aromaticivorans]
MMRLKASFVLIASALCCAHALADITPPITDVVLHPGTATVTRTAQVAPGMNRVVFSGLPANFDPQTLRALAGQHVRVGQIESQDAAAAEALNAGEAELEGRIRALQDQVAALDAEIASAELVKSYLQRFGANVQGKGQTLPADAAGLTGLVAALGQGASDTLSKIHGLNLRKRDMAEQIATLERDLESMRSGARDTRTVTVHLAAAQAGELKLSYQVPGASWTPTYRVELDTQNRKMGVERRATITQRTGEDWSGVNLTLSTTQPQVSPAAPEPHPWLLRYMRPDEGVSQLSGSAERFALRAKAAAPALAVSEDAMSEAYAPVVVNHSQFATEYAVPTKVSLPSDGRNVAVTLTQDAPAAKHYLRVTPRLERTALVMAEAERPEGVWLPGEAQLYRDGSYVGTAQWSPASLERFTFSFGRDEKLHVAMERVDGKDDESGVFNKSRVKRLKDVVTLTSTHRDPVEVLLLETSPVSTSGEIEVETVFDPQPTLKDWQDRRGVVGWERQLAAGEKARFTFDYTVKHPEAGAVAGLAE